MSLYHINEGHLRIPNGWEDETTNVLGWPPKNDESNPFSLTINRDEPEIGEDLNTYVARQLQALEAELIGYQLLRRAPSEIDGLPAEEVEFTWVSDGDKMAQRQVYVLHRDKVLVFTATVMEEFAADGVQLWETILSNFRFREGMKS
jgi:hypothetical protein